MAAETWSTKMTSYLLFCLHMRMLTQTKQRLRASIAVCYTLCLYLREDISL